MFFRHFFLVLSLFDLREVEVGPLLGFRFKDIPGIALIGRNLALWTFVTHRIIKIVIKYKPISDLLYKYAEFNHQ